MECLVFESALANSLVFQPPNLLSLYKTTIALLRVLILHKTGSTAFKHRRTEGDRVIPMCDTCNLSSGRTWNGNRGPITNH